MILSVSAGVMFGIILILIGLVFILFLGAFVTLTRSDPGKCSFVFVTGFSTPLMGFAICGKKCGIRSVPVG